MLQYCSENSAIINIVHFFASNLRNLRNKIFVVALTLSSLASSVTAQSSLYSIEVLARNGDLLPGVGVVTGGFNGIKAAQGGVLAFTTSIESLGSDGTVLVRYDPAQPPNSRFALISGELPAAELAWDITEGGDVYFLNKSRCSVGRAKRGQATEVYSSFCDVERPNPSQGLPDAVVIFKSASSDALVLAGEIPYLITNLNTRSTPLSQPASSPPQIIKIQDGVPALITELGSNNAYYGLYRGGVDGYLYSNLGYAGIAYPMALTSPGRYPRTLIGKSTMTGEFAPEITFLDDNLLIDTFAVSPGHFLLCGGGGPPYRYQGGVAIRVVAEFADFGYTYDCDLSTHVVQLLRKDANEPLPAVFLISASPTPEILVRGGQLANFGIISAKLIERQSHIEFATPQNFDKKIAMTAYFRIAGQNVLALALASEGQVQCSVTESNIENQGLPDLDEVALINYFKRRIAKAATRARKELSLLASRKGKSARARRAALRQVLALLQFEKRSFAKQKALRGAALVLPESLEPSDDDKERYVNSAVCSGLDEIKDGLSLFRASNGLKPGEFINGLDELKAVLEGSIQKDDPKSDKALALLIKSLINSQFGGEAKDLSAEAKKMYEVLSGKIKKDKTAQEIGKEAENLAKTLFKGFGKSRVGKELSGAAGEIGRGAVVIAEVIYHQADPAKQFEVLTTYLSTMFEKFYVDQAKKYPAAYAAIFGYSLAKPIGDSIARDLGVLVNSVLADACLRVLEKAQSQPVAGVDDPDATLPSGDIGSFSCAFPRTVQIRKDTLPSSEFAKFSCTLSAGAMIPDKPGHCLVEITPPSTFVSGFLEYFGQGNKSKFFDAAFVARRSLN